MIRKLRRKFVLINMLFVSAVLLAVFAVLCLSTYRQIRTDSDEALTDVYKRQVFAASPVRRRKDGGTDAFPGDL